MIFGRLKNFVFVGMLLFALAACSVIEDTRVNEQADTPVTIAISTIPNPPLVGNVELNFTFTEQDGQPVSGALVNVIADHTDMRGMMIAGQAIEQENGRYAMTTNFSMKGNWKISVQIQNEALNYMEEITLVVK
jgi:hypothetical protein